MARAKVPDPPAAQIQAVYEANRQALGNRELVEVRKDIVAYLKRDAEQKAGEQHDHRRGAHTGGSAQHRRAQLHQPAADGTDLLKVVQKHLTEPPLRESRLQQRPRAREDVAEGCELQGNLLAEHPKACRECAHQRDGRDAQRGRPRKTRALHHRLRQRVQQRRDEGGAEGEQQHIGEPPDGGRQKHQRRDRQYAAQECR